MLNLLNEMTASRNYIMNMRPVFRADALFSDETPNYAAVEREGSAYYVRIRFRTWKHNVDFVILSAGEQRVVMEKVFTRGRFDYYEARLQAEQEFVRYYFEVVAGRMRCYYDRNGVSERPEEARCFCVRPEFEAPEWAAGAVMYQIFIDRFYNGDSSNDVLTGEYAYIGTHSVKVEDWNQRPTFVQEFYGGDLAGVLKKLDYLQELGVEVLYFNPLFVSPSNHKYDTQDYDYIDPHLAVIPEDGGSLLQEGDLNNRNASRYIRRVTSRKNLEDSNAFFAAFVEEVHKRGMRVILDGVFNHCGSFNKWLDREKIYEGTEGYAPGAYTDADSPGRDFFRFKDPYAWPDNGSYEGWWGYDTLPKLNYEASEELCRKIIDIGKKWVSAPFHVDGWRLDVAADLGHSPEFNHQFWKRFRREVKESNPEALILAEHYGDCSSWLKGDEWDTIMNYDAFMEPITWFLTGMEKHSDSYIPDLHGNGARLRDTLMAQRRRFLYPSYATAMNELSNHDHSRFLTRTNGKVGRVENLGWEAAGENVNKGVFKEAVVFQMTWPGCPTIYYGDEAGLCGFTDPDNRRTYPWGQEDQELIQFHRDIIRLRKENPVLIHGSVLFLQADRHFIAFGRFDLEEQIVVALNNRGEGVCQELSVWELGLEEGDRLEQILFAVEEGYALNGQELTVEHGNVRVALPAVSAAVFRRKREMA